MAEIYFNAQSDNGSISEQHALRQWSSNFMGSFGETRDLRVGTRLKSLFIAAGLAEVDTRMIPLPLSAWSGGMFAEAHIILSPSDEGRSQNERYREAQSREHSKAPSNTRTVPIYPATAHDA